MLDIVAAASRHSNLASLQLLELRLRLGARVAPGVLCNNASARNRQTPASAVSNTSSNKWM